MKLALGEFAAGERLQLPKCSGILLFGPSGCGKTHLLQALSAETHMHFVQVRGSVAIFWTANCVSTTSYIFSSLRQLRCLLKVLRRL